VTAASFRNFLDGLDDPFRDVAKGRLGMVLKVGMNEIQISMGGRICLQIAGLRWLYPYYRAAHNCDINFALNMERKRQGLNQTPAFVFSNKKVIVVFRPAS
jgi:hypothetical protein